MKAISLWEPWASLIWTEAKRFETRGYKTKYRGPLVICAAKAGLTKSELLSFLYRLDFQGGLAPLVGKPLMIRPTDFNGEPWRGVEEKHLQFGKALCVVDLVDCIRTNDMTREQIGTDASFGDFSPYRYAWKLENVRRFVDPFPVKGKQGFFDVEVSGQNMAD